MKTLFTLFLATATLFTVNAGAQTAPAAAKKGPASQAKILKRADIDALLAKPSEVLIVDVRRPDEIQTVGGFPVYLNVQIAELESRLAFIPRDRTIIALSNHAARGGKAADILTKAGFKVAGAAGAQNYEEEGGKLVKIAPPAPRPAAGGEAKK